MSSYFNKLAKNQHHQQRQNGDTTAAGGSTAVTVTPMRSTTAGWSRPVSQLNDSNDAHLYDSSHADTSARRRRPLSSRGRGEDALLLYTPRVSVIDPDVIVHDVATQCAPAEATRFYFQSSERSREGAAATPFVRAHFDVVADREEDDKWITMDDFERIAYDESVCPPGHHPPGFRQTAESMLDVPDAVGGVWEWGGSGTRGNPVYLPLTRVVLTHQNAPCFLETR